MKTIRSRSPSLTAIYVDNVKKYPVAAAFATAAGVLTAAAFVNWRLAKKAERENPPQGRFLEIDGVHLHYVERGTGEPLVLLHGNGSMIQDFESSGLIELASQSYRTIVFDRPGFGHSTRPRNVVWTPQAQADLFNKALVRLNVDRAIVLGHSWGASVAIALATRHPSMVAALVLASGYYFPTARADVLAQSGPAIPGFGDVAATTVAPLLSRAIWPLMLRKLFGPAAVPGKFHGFPKAMAVRPSQIRASAAEAAMMIPAAFHGSKSYGELKLPVVIIAGEDDRLIDIDEQSGRLHSELKQSKMRRVAGAGHMVQQSATNDVMDAIHEAGAN
ncbi:alpha/beta hydrolase [Bradyrhizobium sp. CCBAU 21365]|uniref:alpha/beta fold hydrolase n=1 Tax=Bradyrhizobium sp. CCBAU 21365 TaxID=1325083 RepID=UPI00188AABD4|nr:alpha/beta hydrolase [Bradyrhizobium sp. CCBAU 21365]QOZ20838.1 alpha/beta hydrolase [Bradyrhizobium sp. CCBAU 21365]